MGISWRERNHHGRSLRSATDGCAGTEGHGHGNSKKNGLLLLSFLSHLLFPWPSVPAGFSPRSVTARGEAAVRPW
jgi:hypothetical protein